MGINTSGFKNIIAAAFCSFLWADSVMATTQMSCDEYASKSVLQQITSIESGCDLIGEHWSPLFNKHQRWCLQQSVALPSQSMKHRHQQLAQCGRLQSKGSRRWSDLPYGTKNQLAAALVQAIKHDDLISLQLFESQGFDLGFEWDMTQGGLLYWAISNQASQVVHYLIDTKQANPNLSRNGGPNPLVNLLNHISMVNYRLLEYLLQNGAMPNHGGEDFSETALPLPVATANNDLQAVKILLRYKADPNLFELIPPLMMAIDQNNSAIVDTLLDAGANPNVGMSHMSCKQVASHEIPGEYLPLDAAQKHGNKDIIASIVKAGGKSSTQCRSGS